MQAPTQKAKPTGGRPMGSKNRRVETVIVCSPRCPRCLSTRVRCVPGCVKRTCPIPLGYEHTAAGLRAAQRHLAPDGVLGVWSYAESSPFAEALREVFREVRIEPVTFVNDLLDEETTDWLFFARD